MAKPRRPHAQFAVLAQKKSPRLSEAIQSIFPGLPINTELERGSEKASVLRPWSARITEPEQVLVRAQRELPAQEPVQLPPVAFPVLSQPEAAMVEPVLSTEALPRPSVTRPCRAASL